MIDFTLTETDQAVLDHARAGALLCRKHARYYDENEHEMAPEVLSQFSGCFSCEGDRRDLVHDRGSSRNKCYQAFS